MVGAERGLEGGPPVVAVQPLVVEPRVPAAVLRAGTQAGVVAVDVVVAVLVVVGAGIAALHSQVARRRAGAGVEHQVLAPEAGDRGAGVDAGAGAGDGGASLLTPLG